MNQIENGDTVSIVHGKHTGRSGIVTMIYYDHKHTGESDDLLLVQLDEGGVWIKSSQAKPALSVQTLANDSSPH